VLFDPKSLALKVFKRTKSDSNLLKVEVKIVTITVFENSTKGIGVNLEDVKEPDNPRVLK
jgi:hypothetical protein